MATSSRRSCVNDPNVFCYIYGEYTLEHNRKLITDFVKQAYLADFKEKLGDQDKLWATHIACKTCIEHLRQWTKKQKKVLRFAIPMVWREPKDHYSDCYFCGIKTKGINRKNITSLTYPSLDSAIRPVPHSEELPIPVFEGLPQLESALSSKDDLSSTDSETIIADNDFPPSLLPEVEFSRTSLASRTSSRTHFEVLGLGLGFEASSPRKLPCPRLEDSTIF